MPLWSDFHFWSPPEDPERPPFPYASVFTVTITEHVPPQPFGLPSVYPFIKPPYDTSNEHLKTLTGKPFQAVAKIFDPLYYSFEDENAPYRPVATTLAADSDYSIEAAAYTYLQKTGHTGGFAPKYYESAALGFTEEHRLDVLARILDADTRLEHSGINQRDLLPRNIMLKLEPEAEDPLGKKGRPPVAWKYRKSTELPLNPIDLFWSTSLDDFGYWQEWLIERFGGGNALAYAPVSRELELDDA
ncbi:uncharacterized protein P884DRAFT_275649 [Thermothelomyces heterothallicus CBS 202.75]|uniref:uncharacterized protein n=1 Tax=Thermothelomyces heterothallicus CBS 202.75 TaxID=1149848 RepID=UPI0037445BE9